MSASDRATAGPVLLPGTRLGPYEVLAPLGSGGMGEVYRARDDRLGREVAVKVLPPGSSSDADRIRRFEQEARAAGALSHPNLLTVHDTGHHEGQPYIVFELLAGETLRQRLGPGALPVARAIDYAVQIAQGLAAAHERGIVHRDLKPENLFVNHDGRVKILDFGLAKLRPALDTDGRKTEATTASEITAAGTAVGTAGYMAPEQVQGRRADARSDIFSLGAVLYEMLSGRRAFQGQSAVETMAAILKEEPPELATIRPDIPPPLDRVVRRCLEKRAEDRFQSARDLAFALDAVRGADPAVSAPSRGRLGTAARFPPRAWAAAGALVVALLLSFMLRPLPTPQILGSTQLTFSGGVVALEMHDVGLGRILTDGARIYFLDASDQSGNRLRVAYVSKAGGEAVLLDTSFEHPLPLALSPDGDRLLIRELSHSWSEGPLWIIATHGGAPRRLGEVIAQDATWSPDGRSLVFARGQALFRAGSDGEDPRPLVQTPGQAYWIRFSPDGRRLRFTTLDTTNRRSSLMEVSVDGTGLHDLALEWDERSDECCGEWSRDGRYFVFTAFREQGADLWVVDDGGILRRAARKPKRLTSSSFDSVVAIPSADGKKLFAVETRGSLQMFKYDPRLRQFKPFPFRRVRQVDFSADGQWIVYVEFQGRKQALMRSRLDGSQPLQLTTSPMEFWDAHWSPDGSRIAFVARRPGEPYRAYVVSREGGEPRPVLPDGGNEIDLEWSPDGRSLMFGRPPSSMGGPEGKRGIHIVDLESKRVETLPGSDGLFSPRWSPDGRRVVAMPSDQRKLVLFDFETARWRDLAGASIGTGLAVDCRPYCHNPRWSADGRYVYFENRPDLLRVAVADLRVERVVGAADLPNVNVSFDGLTPDGSVLLATYPMSSDIHALEWQVP